MTKLIVLATKPKIMTLRDFSIPMGKDIEEKTHRSESIFFRVIQDNETERPNPFWIYMMPISTPANRSNPEDPLVMVANLNSKSFDWLPLSTQIEWISIEEMRVCPHYDTPLRNR